MVTGWATLWNTTDNAFYFIMAISVILLVGIMGTMLYFVFRYSKERNPQAENIASSVPLEILWTVIPTLIVLAMFWVGWKGFIYKRTVPAGSMQVKVVGRMWSWSFTYENGKKSSVLKLPYNKPVKLLITSQDVLHSVFIPAFRVKEDAVPGKETYLWFLPDQMGKFDVFCSEFCGAGHADMITKVEVVSEEEFKTWLQATETATAATDGKVSLPVMGERLVREKGCLACHSTDGTARVGPSFKALWGKKETVIRNGVEVQVVIDEEHIRLQLFQPEKDRVKGFPPMMPSQKGLVNDDEARAIIEYLKTQK